MSDVEILILQFQQLAFPRTPHTLPTQRFLPLSTVTHSDVPPTLGAVHFQTLQIPGNRVVQGLLAGKGCTAAATTSDFGLVGVGVVEAGEAGGVSAGKTQGPVVSLVVGFAANGADVRLCALHFFTERAAMTGTLEA